MTEREKHIDALKDLKEWLITFSNGSHVKEIEAIDYAISSLKVDLAYDLEYERTTKNDLGVDYIDRADALNCLKATELKKFDWIIDAREKISNLPSVTPQEPRIDFEELKRKILMEVDSGTDDAWLAYGEVCNRISNSIDEYVQNIKAMPSVTPIRPKGHWIMTNDYLTTAYGSIDYVKCSCCGEDSLEEGNYCPNCGSDNREVKV